VARATSHHHRMPGPGPLGLQPSPNDQPAPLDALGVVECDVWFQIQLHISAEGRRQRTLVTVSAGVPLTPGQGDTSGCHRPAPRGVWTTGGSK
jgi:hypothetical protein